MNTFVFLDITEVLVWINSTTIHVFVKKKKETKNKKQTQKIKVSVYNVKSSGYRGEIAYAKDYFDIDQSFFFTISPLYNSYLLHDALGLTGFKTDSYFFFPCHATRHARNRFD